MGEQPASRLKVAATVTFYVVAALAMVMANKWVLNSTKTPLFFLLAQLVIAVVLFMFAHIFGILRLPPRLDPIVCRGLVPMVTINVVGLSFNNYCLQYVDASFYQIARGLVLPFTVLLSVLLLTSPRPSLRILLSCGLVTTGFLVGIAMDPSPSSAPTSQDGGPTRNPSLGILFGLVSTLTTALHAVVIKRSLEVVKGNALELSWYSNVLSAMIIVPLIWLVGEVPDVVEMFSTPSYNAASLKQENGELNAFGTFLWGSLITGVIGFLISIAGFLSIKITSPISHMITSAVRGVVQTFLGMWLFQDIITGGRGSSIALILVGSIYYTWVKNEETLRAQRENGKPGGLEGGSYERVPLEDRQGKTVR